MFGNGGDGLGVEANFGRKWGWYQSIYALAQGDITRFRHITEMTMHECLTMLVFLKEKNEYEAKQIKHNTR